MKLAIVIPTINEEANLKVLLPKINSLFPSAKIFVIDDLSTDDTVAVAKKYQCIIPYTVAKRGLGMSYAEGVARAFYEHECDIVATMDADHPAEALQAMWTVFELEYFDFEHGVSMCIGHELGTRRITSIGASWIAKKLLGIKYIRQPTCGLMMFSKDLIDKIGLRNIKSESDTWHLELLFLAIKKRAKIAEVNFNGIKHGRASLLRTMNWLDEVVGIKIRSFKEHLQVVRKRQN